MSLRPLLNSLQRSGPDHTSPPRQKPLQNPRRVSFENPIEIPGRRFPRQDIALTVLPPLLHTHLRDRAFMLGEEPTIADFSMVGYHYYNEATGIDRSAFPNIDAWTRHVAAVPGWQHSYD
ncbi:MAG TPA: glutathione binding-like protein [Steroidobacteraceae bacterium]